MKSTQVLKLMITLFIGFASAQAFACGDMSDDRGYTGDKELLRQITAVALLCATQSGEKNAVIEVIKARCPNGPITATLVLENGVRGDVLNVQLGNEEYSVFTSLQKRRPIQCVLKNQ